MKNSTQRRDFLIKVSSISAVIASGGMLSACGGNESPMVNFDYGVASGDPLSDCVILWTHAKFQELTDAVPLSWQVATDLEFSKVVASGTGQSSSDTGYTFKVDAKGLLPNQTYYYRFKSGLHTSPIGKTKTLPTGSVNDVKLAVLSCSNYPAGFFNVYSEVAKSDVDVAVHLGDYIYEYAATGYASDKAASLGRLSVPANELLTLSDYRLRHAQYKSDADAKQFHANKPMIAVWDDHEFTNDTYKDGAENHTPATEGSFAARKAAAMQAYHEWMPIRTGSDKSKIYRSFNFGNLLSLHMLDTRSLGRDLQVEITDLIDPAKQASALATLTSPTRQLMGSEQVQWLQTQMATSTATWQVLGQQVLMARMEFPLTILQALNPSDTSSQALAAGQKAITDYLTAKAKQAQSYPLTPTETALLNQPKLGYNLDAWDGYPAAREILLMTAAQLQKKLVVLAGDTHNAWHSDLTLLSGQKVGEEFATSSVSSPGLETYLALPPAQVKAIFEGVVKDLKWMDSSRRGYLKLSITPSQVQGEWFFIDTITSKAYKVDTPTASEKRIYSA
ncbi:MAG: Phospholipase precursor [Pseudomonadota bacterium]|jgi:alkaline phosphatase D